MFTDLRLLTVVEMNSTAGLVPLVVGVEVPFVDVVKPFVLIVPGEVDATDPAAEL